MHDFVAIDFETANGEPSSVCSVGAVMVRGGCVADSFYSLIHPEPDYYSWFCRRVHGLGPDDTASAPLFPGITDVQAIISRAKKHCNLVWLENLNLRGDYKGRILQWIHEHHPELDGLYHAIYNRRDRTYWQELDADMRHFCADEGLPYLHNDDSQRSPHGQPPVVVNYFYHEEITPAALRASRRC